MKNNIIRLKIQILLLIWGNFMYAQNVGVGTTTPTHKLHVAGNARITNTPQALSSDSVVLRFTDGELRQMSISRLLGQLDLDGDGIVDANDSDLDGDGIANTLDTCVRQYGCAPSGCPRSCIASPVLSANCIGFVTGTYVSGVSMTGTYRVRLTNNSLSSTTLSLATADLALSGVSGITVTSVSPASITLAAGATDSVTYTISGTPATFGTLTGLWTKSTLTCSASKAVTGLSGLFAASYCDSSRFNGTMVSAVAFNGNTFTVKLTNTSGATTPTLPAPTTANLALSYTGTGTLTVASVSPNTTYTIAAGGSQTITYTLSGTPTSTGTLTGAWTYSDLTCTKTRPIGLGDAVFPQAQLNRYVFSVNDVSIPLNSQGTLATGQTGLMPYTSGAGSYNAYTSPDIAIPSQFCEDGASNWTIGYSYPAGTFSASGNITVTYITKKAGVITAWTAKRVSSITTINFNCASVPWVVNGNTYSNTVGLDEGGDAIRGGIASGGNTNGSNYDAASIDEAITITAAEYNAIATIVPGATRYGATTALMSSGVSMGANHHFMDRTVGTYSLGGFPINHYVCAFWTKSGINTGFNPTGKLYFSNASQRACSNISYRTGNLGTATIADNYWAVKRPTTPNPLTGPAVIMPGIGYGSCFYVTGTSTGTGDSPGTNCSTAGGNWITTYNGNSVQAITTSQKSW